MTTGQNQRSAGGSDREAQPQQPPRSVPSFPQHPDQHSFLLQAVFDLKAANGRLEESVSSLKQTVQQTGTKIDTLRNIAYLVAGAIMAGFLLEGQIPTLISALLRILR